jgi:hypothetical protein
MATALPIVISGGLEAVLYQEEIEHDTANAEIAQDFIGDGTDLPPLQLGLLPLKWMMITNGMVYLVRRRAIASQGEAKA